MEQTYIDIMMQSLDKKIQVLDSVIEINKIQYQTLKDEDGDADVFDKTVEDKSILIEQLEQLDSGFDKLYDRVKDELVGNKEAHKDAIEKMQKQIHTITDRSMEVQAQEARNKELMMQKFAGIKSRAKKARTNHKAANQYYKNMMQMNVVDPQFLDENK